MNRHHLSGRDWTALLVYVSMLVDGYNLTVITPALNPLKQAFAASPAEVALLASSAIIGNFVGAIVLGRISDYMGRKYVVIIDVMIFAVGGVLSAISTDAFQLIIFRFIVGLGIGGDYPVASAILMERSRGGSSSNVIVGRLGTMWTAGFVLSVVAGIALSGSGPESWRILFLLPVVPSISVVLLRHFILEPVHPSRARKKYLADLSSLFTGRQLTLTVFGSLFWFSFDVVQYGITLFSPSIIGTISGQSGSAVLYSAGVVGMIELAGTLCGVYILSFVTRRSLLIIGFLGIMVSLLCMSLVRDVLAGLLVIAVFGFFAGLSPGILEFIFPPALFPEGLRGFGCGISNSASRLGAIIGIVVEPVLSALFWPGAVFLFYSMFAVLGIVSTFFLAPRD